MRYPGSPETWTLEGRRPARQQPRFSPHVAPVDARLISREEPLLPTRDLLRLLEETHHIGLTAEAYAEGLDEASSARLIQLLREICALSRRVSRLASQLPLHAPGTYLHGRIKAAMAEAQRVIDFASTS